MRDKNGVAQELNVSWEVVKKKWRSVRDQLDCERRPLVVVLLNIMVKSFETDLSILL